MAPPYLNKNEKKLQKQVERAEYKENRAKIKYEVAKEYTTLCRKALEDAKK